MKWKGGDTMDTHAGQGEQSTISYNGAAPLTADSRPRPEEALPEELAHAHTAMAGIADELAPDADDRPTVETRAWLKQDDYWKRTTYIAVTGRHTAAAPGTRPLPRPKRFQRRSRVRSLLILALTLALIVLIPLGVVVAQQEAAAHIKLPTNIPGLSQPTPTLTPAPTATTKPTATPKKKK